MKISFSQNINTFGSKPIYPIKLKSLTNGDYKLVNATFSELLPNDEQDCDTMAKIAKNWRVPDFYFANNLARRMSDTFHSSDDYWKHYAVELNDSQKDAYERTMALLEITNPTNKRKNNFQVCYIQAAPHILENPAAPPMKGSGELGMYGAVRLAKENLFNRVILDSVNDDFYDAIGFQPGANSGFISKIYELPSAQYENFLDRVTKKYSLSSDNLSSKMIKGKK